MCVNITTTMLTFLPVSSRRFYPAYVFSTPPENWTVRAFLQLTPRLSNDFTAAWLTFTFPQLFAVAASLKSIDYNVAMTFILNNNNNNRTEISTRPRNSLALGLQCGVNSRGLCSHPVQGEYLPPENNCIPLTNHSELPLRCGARCTKICVRHMVACKLLLCTLQ